MRRAEAPPPHGGGDDDRSAAVQPAPETEPAMEVRPGSEADGVQAERLGTRELEGFLLDQVRAAVIATDVEGRIIHWNHHAEVLLGSSAEEAMGKDFREHFMTPGHVTAATDMRRTVLSGHVWEGEFPLRTAQGETVLCYVTLSPMKDALGNVTGVVSVSVDVTERVRQERLLAARTAVTRTLAEAPELAEAAPSIMRAVCENLGWEVGALWRVDSEAGVLRCVGVWHAPAVSAPMFEALTRKTRFVKGIGLPGRVWESGQAAWIPDVAVDGNFPRASTAAAEGLHGAVGFPIRLGPAVLGVMEFFSDAIRRPDGIVLTTMRVIGSQIGQFIERREAEHQLMESRERLRTALAGQRFLVEAGAVLASSLDFETTLAWVARLVVTPQDGPALADWCAVHMTDERHGLIAVAVEHRDPSKVELARELSLRYPPDPNARQGVAEVIRTGRSEMYPEITEAVLAQAAIDDEHLALLRALGLRSAMAVPLSVLGRTFGAITLASAESGRVYGPDDLALAEELAKRAALAVENARLYSVKTEVARKLQEALLPPELPAIPGMELAGRYRWGGRGNEVGGDFFDAFATQDGSWALVIGDVCGKGPEAAVVTGLARYTLRAVAMQQTKPSRALAALNEAVRQQRSDRTFCTVCYARLRLGERGARVTICSAGHPLPIVLRADGTVETAGTPGTLLGIFPEADLSDQALDLGPGDTLVMFTDGVTEERAHGAVFGRARLESLVRGSAGMDADGIASAVEKAVLSFGPDPLRDDIAVLVLRVRP